MSTRENIRLVARASLATSNMNTFFSGMQVYADRILDEIPIYIGKEFSLIAIVRRLILLYLVHWCVNRLL